MSEQTLHGLFDTVWSHISRGIADRRHPARHPALATIGPDGPEVRTLVLRGADRAGAILELHTDTASPKTAQIAADPRVALHMWLPGPRLQIRARALAEIVPGDAALFDRLPPEAQANYGGAAPGTPVESDNATAQGDPARFARVICRLEMLDILHLGTPHRRAAYRADAQWAGRWIAP